MGLSLGKLIYVCLLLVNAIAVLSEERFLARIGWSTQQPLQGVQGFTQPYDIGSGAGQDLSIKAKIVNLIGAVRTLMRIPLVGANLAIILYELLLG